MFYSAFLAKANSGKFRLRWGTPPPSPLKRLDWHGLCKKALQNLEPLRLRGQNIDNKRVMGLLAAFALHCLRLTMICFLNFEVKVGRHRAMRKPEDSGSASRLLTRNAVFSPRL